MACGASDFAESTICLRRQANALVGDVHATIAGAGRDLLGAVGMAVEAGLADEEFQPPPKLAADRIDRLADFFQPLGPVGHGTRNPRGATIFAVHLPHDRRPIRRW